MQLLRRKASGLFYSNIPVMGHAAAEHDAIGAKTLLRHTYPGACATAERVSFNGRCSYIIVTVLPETLVTNDKTSIKAHLGVRVEGNVAGTARYWGDQEVSCSGRTERLVFIADKRMIPHSPRNAIHRRHVTQVVPIVFEY